MVAYLDNKHEYLIVKYYLIRFKMEGTKELYIDDQFQRPNDKCKWISGWIEKKCADEHLILFLIRDKV